MRTITLERSIGAPPGLVWEVVTDHDRYGELAPNLDFVDVVEGESDDLVRRCVDTDGNEWTETCIEWTDGRKFRVSVDVPNSDFHRRLFHRFEGEWAVIDRPDDVLVTMTFAYETRFGPLGRLVSMYLDRRAPSLLEPIFDGWEAAVEERLAALEPAQGEQGDSGTRAPTGEIGNSPTNRLER